MTFDAQENSVESGEPIILFEFATGGTTTYFTAAAEDWTDGSSPAITYTAEAISISPIRSTSNIAKEDVTVRFPASSAFAEGLFGRASSETVVTIKSVHLTDGAKETKVKWLGYLAQPKRTAQRIELTCRSFLAKTEKLGRTPRTQRNCNWTVYEDACGIALATFQVSYTVSAQSGLTYTVSGISGVSPALDADYFVGGVLEYNGERRRIAACDIAAGTVTLKEDLAALSDAVGSSPSVSLAPGCPRTRAICASRFNNLVHYLGSPEAPTVNRFSGSQRVDLG